jgi:hypothetical protein
MDDCVADWRLAGSPILQKCQRSDSCVGILSGFLSSFCC